MRTARAARAVQLSGACVRANKERGYPSVENFWNDLNKLLSDFYKVTVYKGRWVQYLEGLGMTIALAALACLIGVCIGVLVALVKYYAGGKKSFGWKTVNAACGIYVTVIRGTPIVVQLLIAYTILFNGSFEACVFAFGVNSGAYVAEIIRGGIASIDPGQAEAGRSLGLSESATMRLIVLPQAVKNILPALFNEFIALLKETSVAGYIAARDLTKVSDSIRGIAFNSAPLFIAAAIYLLLVVGMTAIQKKWNGGWRKVIEVKNLQKAFGGNMVLKGVTETIEKGEKIAIIGPSGSGKSTFLRCLNRLEEPTGGEIWFEGKDITAKDCDINRIRRKMGMVFQHFNLFPHLTVRRNVEFALDKTKRTLFGRPSPAARKSVDDLLERFEVGHLAERYPREISGGQRQRVALARALITAPRMLLLDEPFAALDPLLRVRMRREIRALLDEWNIPVVLITHDPADVDAFADSLAVYRNGMIRHVLDDYPARRASEPDALSLLAPLVEV